MKNVCRMIVLACVSGLMWTHTGYADLYDGGCAGAITQDDSLGDADAGTGWRTDISDNWSNAGGELVRNTSRDMTSERSVGQIWSDVSASAMFRLRYDYAISAGTLPGFAVYIELFAFNHIDGQPSSFEDTNTVKLWGPVAPASGANYVVTQLLSTSYTTSDTATGSHLFDLGSGGYEFFALRILTDDVENGAVTLDNFGFAAVPEPTSGSLVILASFVLLGIRLHLTR